MFLLWECSTPFVFARWGLHTLGRTNSKLYLYNGLTMMAVFFVCRNVMGVGEPHALAQSSFPACSMECTCLAGAAIMPSVCPGLVLSKGARFATVAMGW